jgi:hypothetical protein
LFFKNNTGAGQDKQDSGNIGDYCKVVHPGMPEGYEHIRKVMIINGQTPHHGYRQAIEDAAYVR